MSDDKQLFPAETIAKLLMLDIRRIQQLAKEGIIPKASKDKYPLVGCVQGYIKYLRQEEGGGSASNEYHQARARRMNAQAHLAEMAAQRSRGEMIPAPLVRNTWLAITERFKDGLLTLPDRLAARLIGVKSRQDAKDILQKEVKTLLEDLSKTEIKTTETAE